MPFKTTKQKYYIVREDLASIDLVNKRVKIELTEKELNSLQSQALIPQLDIDLNSACSKIRKVLKCE